MKRKRRLLLLSVSAGAGHVRAAEALRVAATESFDAEARHLDVMDYVSTAFRALYTDFYSSSITRRCGRRCITDRTPPNAPLARVSHESGQHGFDSLGAP